LQQSEKLSLETLLLLIDLEKRYDTSRAHEHISGFTTLPHEGGTSAIVVGINGKRPVRCEIGHLPVDTTFTLLVRRIVFDFLHVFLKKKRESVFVFVNQTLFTDVEDYLYEGRCIRLLYLLEMDRNIFIISYN
jgi:hypothetical protein